MDRKMLKARAAMEDGDDRPGVQALELLDIVDWASEPSGGGLPEPSATAFAEWLDEEVCTFNEDGDKTNEDVLKGALSYWTGGRR